MRRVPLKYLQSGMKVGRNIYSSDGRVLLTAGMILNENYIARLEKYSIASIYITDELFDGVEDVPDIISEQSRLETVQLVKESFSKIEHNRRINIRAVRKIVDNIIDELLANRELMINLSDIRSYDDYTFSHSVNVCILSLMTAITLGYHQLKLKELGIGALLHDIGKIKLSKEILNKPEELTPEEMEEIKKHPVYGYEILRNYDDVPLLSAHIAFQHHERWDGQGYPRMLKGEDIHEYARIVAVADTYDALLADRPYRPSYSVDQAVTVVSRMSDIYFEPRALAALVSHIAIFPVGSIVLMSTGQVGLVVDVNKDAPTRPVIRVLFDTSGKRLHNPHEVDLTRLSTVYISRILSEQDILELINSNNRMG